MNKLAKRKEKRVIMGEESETKREIRKRESKTRNWTNRNTK